MKLSATLLVLSLASFQCAHAIEYVCSWSIVERLAFASLARTAGQTQSKDFEGIDPERIKVITFRTTDKKVLSGYQIAPKTDAPKGHILAIQGNAQRASSLLKGLVLFANEGFVVRIYDYRGFATSGDGPTSFHAIIQDYRFLISNFINEARGTRYLYAMSFGSAVALNAIDGSENLTALILDSVPDTLSRYGCPDSYDPVNLAKNYAYLSYLVVSNRDKTLSPDLQSRTIEKARAITTWRVLELNDSDHPFTPGIEQGPRIREIIERARIR